MLTIINALDATANNDDIDRSLSAGSSVHADRHCLCLKTTQHVAVTSATASSSFIAPIQAHTVLLQAISCSLRSGLLRQLPSELQSVQSVRPTSFLQW